MKVNIRLLLAILLVGVIFVLGACAPIDTPCTECVDDDRDGLCDVCGEAIPVPPTPDKPDEPAVPDVSGISLPSMSVTYNGERHSLDFVGALPEGVQPIFEGNGKTAAGLYTVNLKFYYLKDGTLDEIPDSMLTATLEIKRADYDITGVELNGASVTYDGEFHTLPLVGADKLPSGLSYTVTGGGTDVGTYDVTCEFTSSNANYNTVEPLKAEINILPATVGGLIFSDATFVYDGTAKTIEVQGLPAGIGVSYTGSGVSAINVGPYKITATFDTGDNYNAIPPMEATLTILPAPVDISGVTYSGTEAEFDGNPKTLTVNNLPEMLDYTLSESEVFGVGEFYITVTFVAISENYLAPAPVVVKMTITLGDHTTEGLLFEEYGDGYAVVGYEGTDTSVIIPATYNSLPVLSVATSAFAGNTKLGYVYMPDSVMNVGNLAFSGCTSLTRVRFGACEVIGQGAFKNTGLIEVDVPASVQSIGFGAFEGTKIRSICLPFIGGSHKTSSPYFAYVFGASSYAVSSLYVPESLTEVTLHDSALTVPAYAFFGLSGIERVNLGWGVRSIGICAFIGCSSIEDIYIPSSVKNIDAAARPGASPFFGCSPDLMLVFETAGGFGEFYAYIDDTTTALTVFGKAYEDYLVNKDDYRIADATDSTLAGIFMDGALIEGYSPSKLEYQIDVNINKGFGLFAAVASSNVAQIESIAQPTSANGYKFIVTVKSGDGSSTKTYTVTLNVEGTFSASSSVTNKDGTDGTVIYVVDDGFAPTGTYLKGKLEQISNLAISFAIKTEKFATLKTEVGEDGITRYVMEDGKYVYEKNTDTINFWRDILDGSIGRSEIVSHTHTHASWGQNDIGGTAIYTSSSGSVGIKNYAENNIKKEFYASKQIIDEIFADYDFGGVVMVTAGITQSGSNYTLTADVKKTLTNAILRLAEDAEVLVSDGVVRLSLDTKVILNPIEVTLPAGTVITTLSDTSTGILASGAIINVASASITIPSGTVIPGYNDYYYGIHEDMIEAGELIGSRLTGKVVYTKDDLVSIETRMKMKAYMITSKTDDLEIVDTWTDYIDSALSKGGIASFCIHAIVDSAEIYHSGTIEKDQGGHVISKAQADKLFAYTEALGDRVWVATLTDAMLYYHQWSTAEVTSSYENDRLTVSLTDGERDDIYDMPLTVTVKVPGTWNNVSDGTNVYEVKTDYYGEKYILINIAPETTVTLMGI